MMTKARNHRSPEEKAALLRRHHIDKVPVTTICEEAGLQPSVFYHWQRELFERAAQVLGNAPPGRASSREQQLEKRLAAAEARLARKDEVIAEISQEYVALKKELGEP
jgi:transposase-like protein